MKGVILCGGTGSRLFPLTMVTNKHLLPVGKKPMIFYPIEKLIQAGIRDILIVTGTEHMGNIVSLLGSGKKFHCSFTYKVQDEPGGIAQALGLAKIFTVFDKIVVILGDNIFEDDITNYVDEYRKQESGAKILIKEVFDPERYGVAELNNNNVISIEEKPQKPKSNFCVTGIYFYDYNVFSIINNLKPSNRGELEITDVNNYYIKEKNLTYNVLKGYWTDAGTFESYKKANELVGIE
jgi:glucose-1-phosphate thymidylyltransferase